MDIRDKIIDLLYFNDTMSHTEYLSHIGVGDERVILMKSRPLNTLVFGGMHIHLNKHF